MTVANVFIYFDGVRTDVTSYAHAATIRRGRSRELDTFPAGTATVSLNNESRAFDPLYSLSPFWRKIRPGLRIVIESDSISLFDGIIEDWNLEYDISNRSVASVVCSDGLARLAQTAIDPVLDDEGNPVPFDSEAPDVRIERILALPEVAYSGSRDLDPGITLLTGDTVSDGTNTTTYLHRVVDTDQGRLFVNGAGVLRYRNRTSGITQNPVVIFGSDQDPYVQTVALLSQAIVFMTPDDVLPIRTDAAALGRIVLQDADVYLDASDPDYIAPLIPFSGVGVEYGTEFLYTRATITNVTGTRATADDIEAQAKYGIRVLSKTDMLFANDTDISDFGQYLITTYANPTLRIASHQVEVHGLSDLYARYMKRLEVGDVVRTAWTPNKVGTAIDRNSLVEGIEHTLTPSTHRMIVQLTPFSRAGFVLDDPYQGLLDTSELTY